MSACLAVGEAQPLGWARFAEPHELLPCDDLRAHARGMECPCNPVFDEEYDMIEHNAFDGREAYEQGRRRPS